MRFLSRKQKPIENIAFIAMMSAFAAIISLISSFFPASTIFLSILLPFSSAMVTYLCKRRYFAVYLVSSFLICFLVASYDPLSTIFYVIPAIMGGALYGLLLRSSCPLTLLLFAVSILQFAFWMISLWLIKLIYSVDMIEVLLSFIGKAGNESAHNVSLLFGYAYALGETALSHLVTMMLLVRLGIKERKSSNKLVIIGCLMLLSIASFAISFASIEIGFLTLGFALYFLFAGFSKIDYSAYASSKGRMYLLLAIAFVAIVSSIILFAILYPMIEGSYAGNGMVSFSIPTLFGGIYLLFDHFLIGKEATRK